jgi:hypothetical protein
LQVGSTRDTTGSSGRTTRKRARVALLGPTQMFLLGPTSSPGSTGKLLLREFLRKREVIHNSLFYFLIYSAEEHTKT